LEIERIRVNAFAYNFGDMSNLLRRERPVTNYWALIDAGYFLRQKDVLCRDFIFDRETLRIPIKSD
jgi:hypothetical protein